MLTSVLRNHDSFLFFLRIFPLSGLLARCLTGWSTYYGGVGSGEYSSGVCLQSGRRMFAGLLKDELSPSFRVIFCI